MNIKFLKDVAERAVNAFLLTYLAAWVASGSNFDGLVDSSNLEMGVIAAVSSVVMSFGLKNVGPHKNSASVL